MPTPSLLSRCGTSPRRWVIAGFAALLLGGRASPALAQDGTGTLLVRVLARADSSPLPGAFVRSGRIGAVADSSGLATLSLPGGLTQVSVTSPGFRTWAFEITIVPNAPQRVEAPLDRLGNAPEALAVRTARSPVRAGAAALPIRITAERELLLVAQLHPSGLEKVFDALPDVRPVAGSDALAPVELRIRGLPGRYTGILLDGVPVYGAIPGEFRSLQVGIFDLEQVELLTGASTALFGPAAPVGAINLISRRPTQDSVRIAFSQTSEKGGSGLLWGAKRFTPEVSGSIAAEFHQQRLVDSDDDQWGEFPRAIRLQVRPRLSIDLPNGDVVNATVGATSEDRTGGFLLSTTDDDPYRQELRTRNVDLGVRGRRLLAGGGRLELKLSGFYQSTSHRIDDQRFRDRRSSFFAEASWAGRLGPGELVAGVSYQRDKFDQLDLNGFDYAHSVPAVFGQLAYPISDLARATLSARCERHNVYGSFCTPHASLLLRPSPWVTARMTASAGYAAPSVLSGRAEVIGLQAFVPTAMNAERIQHGGLELSWIRDRLRMKAQATFTRITRAVQVVPVPDDPAGRLRLVNAANPTRMFAGDLEARYQAGLVGIRAWYSYGYGHEDVPGDTGRRVVGWLPRHALGGAISLDDLVPGSFAELRTRYVGLQYVWDDPFRTKTPGYFLTDGTVSARAGRARLYLSGENLFDVRLRDYEVVVLPAPGLGGQRTATQWLPARGRVISFGATVEW